MTNFDENKYKTFKELFKDIKEIKMDVRLLYGRDLQKYKEKFYKQKLTEMGLDWCWKFIWDEIEYKDLKKALHL